MGWVETLPSGRFRAGFYLPNGRKIQKTHDYRYEAEAWLEDADKRLDDVLAGPHPPARVRPAGTLLVDYANDWLTRRPAAGELSQDTLDRYAREIRRIQAGPLAKMRLDEIRREHIQHALVALAATTGKTVPRKHAKFLRQVFADAVVNGRVGIDPARATPLPAETEPRHRELDAAEAARLLLATDTVGRAFILAALDAGLRWGEVNALSTASLDGIVLTTLQTTDRYGRLQLHTKGRRRKPKPRRVPVTDRLAAALAALEPGPGGILFPGEGGQPRPHHKWHTDLWVPARARANLDGLRFHDLRHTYASRLTAAGVPLIEVATVLGQAHTTTTAIYTHPGSEAARVALIRAALAGTG